MLTTLAASTACFSADPREIDGAISKALDALDEGDKRELYTVIDERARHAMISIVADRRKAAQLVRASYPEPQRSAALAALGDAARAKDAADLFAMRCDVACMAELQGVLGPPRHVSRDGDVVHVRTLRDGDLELYHGSDTWYGIVWHTEALSRERDRAAAEREQVEKNAALYRRKAAMQ